MKVRLNRAMILLLAMTAGALAGAGAARAQAAQPQPPAAGTPEQTKLLASVEAYLRDLFAWGKDFQLKLGPLKEAQMPGFYEVPIAVTFQEQTDTGTVYASKDGKFIIRGELYDTGRDPFAEIKSKLDTSDSPSIGPADAKITLIEFSDFQCPHCKLLSQNLKPLEAKFPKVRIVFKNFPITQIHPWAMTAALAARCVYQSSPDGFWKMHDAIFQQQELISAEDVYNKLTDFAVAAGMNRDDFKSCLANPETQKRIDADIQMEKEVKINSTPTIFINGRENIGGDPATLEQLINFETARNPAPHK